MYVYVYVCYVCGEGKEEGGREREMDKCFQNGGGEHWEENVKCRGNGFFFKGKHINRRRYSKV